MMEASAPSALWRVTVAAVRGQIAAGELALARPAFEALRAHPGPATDVLVTEGLLKEAEGDLVASLARFDQALASDPGSVQANGHLARILARLERPEDAEAAALAVLALDGADARGLAALAFSCARAGQLEKRLDVVRRLAAAPGATAAQVWAALDELAASDRWTDIIQALDEHVGDLPPGRVCARRVEALLELGRQRDALACIVAAHADGHIGGGEMVDRLVARHAFAVAAAFVHQCLEGESGTAGARATVVAAARQACDQTTLEATPFDFADAVQALSILLPDREALHKAVARSAVVLVRLARAHLARGEFSAATECLIRACRLTPTDRTVLEMLADAASRAGHAHRHLATLLRIHRGFPDIDSLEPAVLGAISAGRWDMVGELMSRGLSEGLISSRVPKAIEDFRTGLQGRLDDILRGGDWEGGMALVAGLMPWVPPPDWSPGAIVRLLAAAKRHLRSLRAPADARRISALFLRIDPDDVDVGRLSAALRLRQRRLAEAAESLSGVMRVDPQLARDWLDLDYARDDLGESAAGRWDTLGELMLQAQNEALASSGASEAIEYFRSRLQGRLEDCLGGGDCRGGLALVGGLMPWMTTSNWPPAEIARLLATAKRHLRNPRKAADGAAVGRFWALYLRIDPDDVDVGRLLGRLRLRQRRFGEAVETLSRVVRADPHLARDWLDLANAHDELAEPAERDTCMARALVIAPTTVPAQILDQFWARMAPA
jgi:tetratricopeptide (TPR) repeat protein